MNVFDDVQMDVSDIADMLASGNKMEVVQQAEDDVQPPKIEINNKSLPKGDFAVDHLDLSKLHPIVRPSDVERSNMFLFQLITEFKKKYYRFDNKMLQCFPGCNRFSDVREARLLGYDHRSDKRTQAWCSNVVEARLLLPPGVDINTVFVVGRFLAATPEVSVLPDSETGVIQVGEVISYLPQANTIHGTLREVSQNARGIEAIASLNPLEQAWFFNLQLPRHRRNAAASAHKVPLFVFEMIMFMKTSTDQFAACSRVVSSPFEIASVRTLIREVLAFRQSSEASLTGGSNQTMNFDEDFDDSEKKQKANRRLSTNYSSAVHRVRLSEEAKAKKKKTELVVELIQPPQERRIEMPIIKPSVVEFSSYQPYQPFQPFEVTSVPEWMKNEAFDLPEIDFSIPIPSFPSIDGDEDLDADFIP